MSGDGRRDGEDGFLGGIRVLEVADELGEYCGKLLAGLGADVVKVEPPGGEVTRSYGPFYEDEPGIERSLFHWHYNFGKRGIVLDLDRPSDQERFRALARGADVVLDTRPRGWMAERGLAAERLRELNSRLIVARISPFGDDGPWADWKGSDLVHLALGGVMMNCGYDPEPSGFYETPPIAPQMWHAYHIAGEMTAIGVLQALHARLRSGRGQLVRTSVHQAVAQQTETDLPNWVYSRLKHMRATCRHSRPTLDAPALAATKDGRWLLPYRTYLGTGGVADLQRAIAVLERHGMAEDLTEPKYRDAEHLADPVVNQHVDDVFTRFVNRYRFDRDVWREFQAVGLTWAPERRPEENVDDEHWRSRETFLDVEHPELRRTFAEVGAKWMCLDVPWRKGPRAPLLGEHTDEVLAEAAKVPATITGGAEDGGAWHAATSRRGKPFALDGVRFIDLSWLLASAGAGRFLAAAGAEVIKVEHKSRWDFIRWDNGVVGPGGRAERERMRGPIEQPQQMPPRPESPNRGGFFMEINAGKRAISLNLKHPRGKELLTRLLAGADVVAEGFSPGTMDRLGFGWDRLRDINSRLVYVQQSGMGQLGTYGNMRSYGPVAQGFSGISEMSGLPEPYPPAGIGYSFLDWYGAYNMAVAIFAALYRRERTGVGCWIDSSQVEAGIYLNGTAILDHSANGRRWRRYGNRSPYKPAAPHGAYRAAGQDRWIAIACFDEAEWQGLLDVLGSPAWGADERFATRDARLAHQEELDVLVEQATAEREPFALMAALQAAGVPAGVCQTAQDRFEDDPQLRHLEWMIELAQSEIGTWPVKEAPALLSETPSYMGGPIDRHGPNYGEDNEYVYGELLGLSSREIRELEDDGVI